MSLRHLLYQLLDHRYPSLASKTVDISIMSLILLNVFAVVLGSVKGLYQNYQVWFEGFELLSV
ncbi:MAG TPA: ion transporter, partial [Methylothermaceae bacterium]|nr:ion transporter [Methylothermaceae bacterium]